MIPYLYVLMTIIGVAFLVVLAMIFDAVFNEAETGMATDLVYETSKRTSVRGSSRAANTEAA